MTTSTSILPRPTDTAPAALPPWAGFVLLLIALFQRIPDSLIAFVGRFSEPTD